jgi:hypothetical protein
VDVVCAPLQSPEAFEDVTFWDYDHYGFSFSPCRAKAPHEPVEHRIASHELLGRATRLASLDFATVRTPKVTATAEVPIERNGLLHGFGLWYVHWLTERISVSSGPQCELHPSVWPSFFLPMQAPTAVTEGDTATMTFQTTPRAWRDIWSWRGTIRNAQGVKASFNQSTFFALPLSKDLVHKSAAERKPTLNPRGEAARLILEMCKEARPLGIIEDEVAGAFPKLFRDRATAASFVAKTLEPYSQ